MEWDLKLPSWDLAELERDAEPRIGSIIELSGSLGHHIIGQDCSVDLKLGALGDFGSSDKWRDQPKVSTTMTMVSSTNTSKRARAPSNGRHTVSCLVDGCMADLSKCREYHRRHKVCEVHSKTPTVMVGGREQRFCQQCSRFHLLVEFDEVKRSCRKRLDGHNRRRRKPRLDFINAGNLITNHRGTGFPSDPQTFPTGTPEPNWTKAVKSEEYASYTHHLPLLLMERQQHLPCSSRSYKGKQFPFLQDGDAAFNSRMMLGMTIASSDSSNSKMFSKGITQVLNSDCALSLLSSSSQTSGINLSQMVPADRNQMGQPLASGLQYDGLGRYSHSQAWNSVSPTGFSCSSMEDRLMGAVLVPEATDAELHSQAIVHIGGAGSSDCTSEALPFSWQ